MGVRGEIFSNKVILPNRTYFFNVKENRMGDLYLNIVESKNRDNGGFERQSVVLFADDLQEFLKGFDESLKVMEKAVRGKRHSGESSARPPRDEVFGEEYKAREDSRKKYGSRSGASGRERDQRDDRKKFSRGGDSRKPQGSFAKHPAKRSPRSEASGFQNKKYSSAGQYGAGGEASGYSARSGNKDRSRPRSEDSGKKYGRDRDNKDSRQKKGKERSYGDRGRSNGNKRVVVKKRDKHSDEF